LIGPLWGTFELGFTPIFRRGHSKTIELHVVWNDCIAKDNNLGQYWRKSDLNDLSIWFICR
jgi:hypothetical protein